VPNGQLQKKNPLIYFHVHGALYRFQIFTAIKQLVDHQPENFSNTARGPSNMFAILNDVNSTWASTNLIIEQSNTLIHVQFSS
jgi:hypothetical protein